MSAFYHTSVLIVSPPNHNHQIPDKANTVYHVQQFFVLLPQVTFTVDPCYSLPLLLSNLVGVTMKPYENLNIVSDSWYKDSLYRAIARHTIPGLMLPTVS